LGRHRGCWLFARNLSTNPQSKEAVRVEPDRHSKTALNGLDWRMMGSGGQIAASCAIARIDWQWARRELAAVRTPVFDAVGADLHGASINGCRGYFWSGCVPWPAEQDDRGRSSILSWRKSPALCALPPKEVDRHRPLAEIGMDLRS